MTREKTNEHLNNLLKARGFSRQRSTWNRKVGNFLDVVNLQTLKSLEKMTINIATVDIEVFLLAWGKALPRIVSEPYSTVRFRIGDIVPGSEPQTGWWDVHDPKAPGEAVRLVQDYGLPFFEQIRNRPTLELLLEYATGTNTSVPSQLAHVILMHVNGRPDEACIKLTELERKYEGNWRIPEILRDLDCRSLPRKLVDQ